MRDASHPAQQGAGRRVHGFGYFPQEESNPRGGGRTEQGNLAKRENQVRSFTHYVRLRKANPHPALRATLSREERDRSFGKPRTGSSAEWKRMDGPHDPYPRG